MSKDTTAEQSPLDQSPPELRAAPASEADTPSSRVEKFGGDSMSEMRRSFDAYLEQLARRHQALGRAADAAASTGNRP